MHDANDDHTVSSANCVMTSPMTVTYSACFNSLCITRCLVVNVDIWYYFLLNAYATTLNVLG